MTNLQEIQRTEKHDNDTTIIGTRVAKPNCENFHRQKSHFLKKKKKITKKNSLAIQCLGLHVFTAKGPGSIPGWGTKILSHQYSKKKRKKKLQSKTSYLRA